jgi:hypothetical protein
MNKVFNVNGREAYYIENVPVQEHGDSYRTLGKHPVQLLHEQFYLEKEKCEAEKPGSFFRDCEVKHMPCFLQNKHYLSLPEAERKWATPYRLYTDATQFNQNGETMWNITCENLVTRKVHQFVVSADFCRCGCRGWCTVWKFFNVLKWCLNLGATGHFAMERHNNKPFLESTDMLRIKLAMKMYLGFYMINVEYGADMPAISKPLGLRAHNHKYYGCIFCWCPYSSLHDYTNGLKKFPPVTDEDIFDEFRKCESRLAISRMCISNV